MEVYSQLHATGVYADEMLFTLKMKEIVQIFCTIATTCDRSQHFLGRSELTTLSQ